MELYSDLEIGMVSFYMIQILEKELDLLDFSVSSDSLLLESLTLNQTWTMNKRWRVYTSILLNYFKGIFEFTKWLHQHHFMFLVQNSLYQMEAHYNHRFRFLLNLETCPSVDYNRFMNEFEQSTSENQENQENHDLDSITSLFHQVLKECQVWKSQSCHSELQNKLLESLAHKTHENINQLLEFSMKSEKTRRYFVLGSWFPMIHCV